MPVVPISRVIPLADGISLHSVRRMKSTLVKQGQIEPLQVHAMGDKFLVFPADPWGSEIVYAARELAWPTLLVVVMNRYEH